MPGVMGGDASASLVVMNPLSNVTDLALKALEGVVRLEPPFSRPDFTWAVGVVSVESRTENRRGSCMGNRETDTAVCSPVNHGDVVLHIFLAISGDQGVVLGNWSPVWGVFGEGTVMGL